MNCTEVNEKGNFDTWEVEKINELKNNNFSDALGNCLYENDDLKLWDLTLDPKERISFRKIKSNYSATCIAQGIAISRNANGKIHLFRFNEGETCHLQYQEKEIISDLENIGSHVLKFIIIEHKAIKPTNISNIKPLF